MGHVRVNLCRVSLDNVGATLMMVAETPWSAVTVVVLEVNLNVKVIIVSVSIVDVKVLLEVNINVLVVG